MYQVYLYSAHFERPLSVIIILYFVVLVSDIVHDDSEELVTMGPPHSDTFPPDTDGHRSVSHLTITACTL